MSWVYYKDEMFKMTAPHLIVEIRYSDDSKVIIQLWDALMYVNKTWHKLDIRTIKEILIVRSYKMNGEEFVKLCYQEKENILNEYFSENSSTAVAKKVKDLMRAGVDKDDLYKLIDSVMTDTYYTLLLGLDGAASLGGKQVSYKIYDEKETLLNKCGEIEEHAFTYFMEK